MVTRMGARQHTRMERGTAILEFSAVLPLIVLMIVSVIEISNAVNQYLQVTRVSFEGARYGASLAGFESGSASDGTPNQLLVQGRMRRLLNDYGLAAETAVIETALIPPSEASTFQLVEVSIEIPVRPVLFSQYATLRLRSASWAPHLFLEAQ